MSNTNAALGAVVALRLYAVVVAVIGLVLTVNGAHLLRLGGSPYYVVCGLAVMAGGILLFLRRAEGALIYGLMLVATMAWALWEAGLNAWALLPRIAAPVVLGLVLLIPAVRKALIHRTPPVSPLRAVAAAVIAVVVGLTLHHAVPPLTYPDPLYQTGSTPAPAATPVADAYGGDWPSYALDGTHFSALAQITPANVAQLRQVWDADLGSISRWHMMEGTPLKIGSVLYICSSANDLFALDAETGKQIWHYESHTETGSSANITCRGVGYYKSPAVSGPCAERIITNTIDARLIAVDARDGKPCRDFGSNGVVSLLEGMGDVIPGYYFVTSAPTVVQDKIILGGWVSDNQFVGEPSGVIRAFDAVTGKLVWAWDMGQPDRTGAPPEGQSYTRGTPNAWGPMAADESLGLVYFGLGNPTPDYYGVQRRPFDEQYGSSIVALDIATGRPRWHFQTVHHDLWDFDVSPQPALADVPTPDGMVPALVQATKRGEVFVLNRATGVPLKTVEERPVSQDGGVPEEKEKLSPTQPFSTGMPAFGGTRMVESEMWGLTPLDQLWCRVKFREARYDGPMTPPGVTVSLNKAGKVGGMNWYGLSIDASRHMVITTSSNLPNTILLIPRDRADKMHVVPQKANEGLGPFGRGVHAQAKTPYAVASGYFMSPLKVPCVQPPHGRISAVDLATGKLVWSHAFGSAKEIGPWGLKSHLPLDIGTVSFGAAAVTQGGVSFIAASQDRTFRAYDTATGKALWKAPLPALANATPMTYISPASGRQFVVVASGGGAMGTGGSSHHLVAFALPEGAAGTAR
jgi:quinoprotein glucose dehydrogenase